MPLSRTKIRELGDRLRNDDYSSADLQLLTEYIMGCDAAQPECIAILQGSVTSCGAPVVSSGRAKRPKSVIRKLRRPETMRMDLARMADLLGFRVVVADLVAQDTFVRALADFAGARLVSIRDSRDQIGGYRCIHAIIRTTEGKVLVEIQIRTLAQQLWANESESFGEAVKEGGGPVEVQEYLRVLSERCARIDLGAEVGPDSDFSALSSARLPVDLRLARLRLQFSEAIHGCAAVKSGSCIVVFDRRVLECTSRLFYGPEERAEAVAVYRELYSSLDDSDFEVLILNSGSDAAIRVTHPRLFESLPDTQSARSAAA